MLHAQSKGFLTIIGLWLIAFVLIFLGTKVAGITAAAFNSDELIKVKFHNLTIDPQSKQPVVLLADSGEERALFIWIGFFEARAMHSEIQGVEPFRPLTHDLVKRIIQKVDGTVHHIVVTHIKENVFYANIVIEHKGALFEIDARPSDSIVMALKFNAPIYVSKKLFDDMAISIAEKKEIEEDYGLTIQDLTPSLAKYMSYESEQGALVSNIRKGSRADQDGIETGDIFVEIDGKRIEDVISMKDALTKSKSAAKAKIFRKTRYLYITIHP
jgi:bifunctional DNase/RNase